MKKVRTGSTYRYRPGMIDVLHPPYDLAPGDLVRVVRLRGCPPPGSMGHAYVEHVDGRGFAGLVHVNSLVRHVTS